MGAGGVVHGGKRKLGDRACSADLIGGHWSRGVGNLLEPKDYKVAPWWLENCTDYKTHFPGSL